MHIQTHENRILAKVFANVFLICYIYRMWPLAASKAGTANLNILSVDFWRPFKKEILQIYIDNIIFWNSSKTIPPTSPTDHALRKRNWFFLVFLYIYICNFGLVFNAETQLNVSIYTVEICKVAGTALIVHAVIHNDMHNTTLFHRFKTNIYIYIHETNR